MGKNNPGDQIDSTNIWWHSQGKKNLYSHQIMDLPSQPQNITKRGGLQPNILVKREKMTQDEQLHFQETFLRIMEAIRPPQTPES